MKFYIYEKNLLHECERGIYDNLYSIDELNLYCPTCNKSAPISIILGFKYRRLHSNSLFRIIGEISMYITDSYTIKTIKSSKSFEI